MIKHTKIRLKPKRESALLITIMKKLFYRDCNLTTL